jgi:hypothetical protein
MTSQSTNIDRLLKELTKSVGSYYIKSKNLDNFEEEDGHIIFSHFKRFDKKITPTLLQQHLQKEITLAISVKNSNILLLDYRGEMGYAFGSLVYKILDKDSFSIYIIEYSLDRVLLYIRPKIDINLDSFREELEELLEAKMVKEWRVYPVKSRPNLGNLMILPREYIESPWSF